MEPTIPYDLDNERAVLGACLLDREAIGPVREILSAEDFYLERHALIYQALLELVERRIPPDIMSVAGQLKDVGKLDSAGGITYLGELFDSVPTSVHVEYYAQRVLKTSAQRRIIELGGQIAARGYEGGKDVSALFDELKQMIDLTKEASSPKANWEEAVVPARLLYNFKFEQEPHVIQDILPQGTMLLTGKPKTRKSWLALSYGMAVANGGHALGRYKATQGDVLYIDLEMGAKRIHKRLHVVSPELQPPSGFQFATKWPRVGQGFESWLRDYLRTKPYTRLVIVDTLVAVRPPKAKYEDPYESDKRFTQALTDLCHEHRIAMLLVHHSRKADGSDITDDASGSTGLVGGVDNYSALRLSRNERGAGELLITGRDIEMENSDLNLKWDARFADWKVTDENVNLTPERRAVLDLLSERPGLKPREIALKLDREEGGTKRLLSNMKDAGLVFNSGTCWFVEGDEPESE